MCKYLLLLFSLFSTGIAQAQDNKSDLVINEVMQSNVETYQYDEINEIPDSWVELYNTTDQTINLKDYSLWDKDKPNKAWKLPDQTLGAHKYVLVFCDKEDESGGMHASFRLDSGNAKVYLFKNGERVDSIVDLQKQKSPDIAYGRKTDGGDEWGYQLTPTPGKANTGEICDYDHILAKPEFSELGRVVKEGSSAINLTLSLPDAPEGAYIAYTTDGSEPTTSSTKYSKAIKIDKTTVIRAKAFCKGWLSQASSVQSYIFHPRDMTIPVVSITTNKKYLDDKQHGIFENNKVAKVRNDWRRPINFEYFNAMESNSILNQLGETRIQGGQSRENALKSMVIYSNKRFGEKRLAHEFFPDQKPGISDYKSVSLRNGGNDFTDLFFRDAIIQRTMGQHVDLDWQACRSVVLYINGEYKGMLNLRERANEDNIFANYNGFEDLDEIEITQVNDKLYEELKEGTMDYYNAFKAFYTESGHTKAEYEQWLDCGELLNMYIMNLYYGNLDFPGNNTVFWCPNVDDSPMPKVWRVIVKDTDFGLGLYGRQNNYNTIEWIYNPNYDSGNAWANTSEATMLFRHMLEDKELFNMFIDRCSIYMGDFLNGEGTGETIDIIMAEVLEEFAAHREKMNGGGGGGWGGGGWGGWGGGWGGWQTDYKAELTNKFNQARDWAQGRTDKFYDMIGKYKFPVLQNKSLGTAIALTVNSNNNVSNVTFNDVKLSKDVFNGKFFANRQINITADAPSGQVITGWRVTTTPTSGSKTSTIRSGSELAMTMPACKSLAIEAIVDTDTGINAVSTRSWTWKRTADGILVSGVAEGTSISLHDLRGITRVTETANGSDVILPAESGKMYLLKVGSETIKIQ